MWSRTLQFSLTRADDCQPTMLPPKTHGRQCWTSYSWAGCGLSACGTTTGDEADHHRAPSVLVKPSSAVLDLQHGYKFQERTKHHTHEKQHYMHIMTCVNVIHCLNTYLAIAPYKYFSLGYVGHPKTWRDRRDNFVTRQTGQEKVFRLP